MIGLIAIKQHMLTVKMATLGSLCREFQAEPETVKCLLAHWMTKGRIKLCMKKPACGSSCFQCPSTQTEIYEWVN